jgi:RNA-directed DNA polymerase
MDASKNRLMEDHSASVPQRATQVEEVRARWAWAEPSVWTDRMLTALEQGVKGGVWFSLIDKVYAPANLFASYVKVASNGGAAGVDHVTVEEFTRSLTRNSEKLTTQLREGTYRPQAVKRVNIPKPGTRETRPLGIPTVRDRVVQGALRHVLEPIFERQFHEHSYGFRPDRGCKDALRRVDRLLKQGYHCVVDVDLKSYFDTIPHDQLLAEVGKYVADRRVLELIEAFLKADILDGLQSWTPESGAPQGAVLSPLLSNLYLNELDHLMAQAGFEMTRYADDLVIQCRTPEEAERALALVQTWTAERGLTLHPTKTKIVDAQTDGFDFLGYRFVKHRRFPRTKSLAKFKEAIRGKTRRIDGRSLNMIIADVNRTLVGWFEYFKHSYRTVFPSLDGWIRMRLRTILRKRRGIRGRAKGGDNVRYQNKFFAEQGLFSLETAYTTASQSSLR